MTRALFVLLLLGGLHATGHAQATTEQLMGTWTFVATLDSNGVQVEEIEQPYPAADGKPMRVKANGPDMLFDKNGDYVFRFTPEHQDMGRWDLAGGDTLLLTSVIPQGSRQGELVRQAEKAFGKRWDRNEDGDLVEHFTVRIASFDGKEMRLVHQKHYVQVFRKR